MSVQWTRARAPFGDELGGDDAALGPSARKHGVVVRAFFAIALAGELRERAAALASELAARPSGDGVRWAAPDALHLTLRFLGNVPTRDVAALVERGQDALAACAPFALALGAPLAFPSARQPRVIALAAQPERVLADLAARLEKVALEVGIAPEPRAFRAHVTLGRVRARRAPNLDARGLGGSLAVREVVLFGSDLGRDGAHYIPLATLPLGASAAPLSPGSH